MAGKELPGYALSPHSRPLLTRIVGLLVLANFIERFLICREWYRIASSVFYKHAQFYFNECQQDA